MITIFKKEINQFFSSLVGYIAIAIFLILSSVFTFIIPTTGVFESGFATLDSFFALAPWFFLFLIPAITMRLFAEEFNQGTIELLATKPISDNQIVLGKYFAALFISIVSIVPTLLFFYTINQLAFPVGNIDTGGIIGSYIGLILLSAGLTAIGIFCSSITSNQIVAFLAAFLLSALFYIGFDYISELPIFFGSTDYFLQKLGINAHYNSLSRGVVDTRDVVYFLSLIAVFILLTKIALQRRR